MSDKTAGKIAKVDDIRPSPNGLSAGQAKHQEGDSISLQIVTGSYERVLHGFTATFSTTSTSSESPASFSDNFLFSAHTSSIRSVAISPPTAPGKRLLATGSADERINLYQISTTAPKQTDGDKLSSSSSLLGSSVSENPRNRGLGSLLHHSRTVTRLSFPTKGKLFSAAEDNTIAITRVRDWTMLSSIKAPVPKAHGRPSGDTAAPGEVPAGVNDFALHPSMKLMISVGRGERCMRLWNLVTGKKANVLNFGKSLLAQVGEGKFGTGEGRRIVWSRDGEHFVVLFERGAAVYNMDSEAVAVIKTQPATKLHQAKFVPIRDSDAQILAVSTEDGRILFFDLASLDDSEESEDDRPLCNCIAQIESATLSSAGRIKDFELMELGPAAEKLDLVFVTASSDGAVRLWAVDSPSLLNKDQKTGSKRQVGSLLGVRETANRLTCVSGFVMDDTEAEEEEVVEIQGDVEASSDGSDSDE